MQQAALSLRCSLRRQRSLLPHPQPAGSSNRRPGSPLPHLSRLMHRRLLRRLCRTSPGSPPRIQMLPASRQRCRHRGRCPPPRRWLPLCRTISSTLSSSNSRRSPGASRQRHPCRQCGAPRPHPLPLPTSSRLLSQRHSSGAMMPPQQQGPFRSQPPSSRLPHSSSRQRPLCQGQPVCLVAVLLPWAMLAMGQGSLAMGRQGAQLQDTARTAALPYPLASCSLVGECCWRPHQASGGLRAVLRRTLGGLGAGCRLGLSALWCFVCSIGRGPRLRGVLSCPHCCRPPAAACPAARPARGAAAAAGRPNHQPVGPAGHFGELPRAFGQQQQGGQGETLRWRGDDAGVAVELSKRRLDARASACMCSTLARLALARIAQQGPCLAAPLVDFSPCLVVMRLGC